MYNQTGNGVFAMAHNWPSEKVIHLATKAKKYETYVLYVYDLDMTVRSVIVCIQLKGVKCVNLMKAVLSRDKLTVHILKITFETIMHVIGQLLRAVSIQN